MPRDWTSADGFEQLVREHQGAVFRTLHRLTGPGAHIEDLAQDVFLRLYRALPEFRGEAALSTYLYRIVLNVAQDEWKRRRREREHLAPAPFDPGDETTHTWLENQAAPPASGQHTRSPEEALQDAERQGAVQAALTELPATERSVLVLYHGEELTYEAIATVLGMPVNTVRTHLHRGRKRLAGLVEARLARPTPVSTQLAGRSAP